MQPQIQEHGYDLLLRIQAYLLSAASRRRIIERPDPFTVTISEHTANPYLNYAIPNVGAQPTPDQIADLERAFITRQRVPRFEYIPQVAPDLEQALVAQGFVVEGRTPLMTCLPSSLQRFPNPPGFEIKLPESEEELLDSLIVQHEAYNDPRAPTKEDLLKLAERIREGVIHYAAFTAESGEAVGAGMCTAPEAGLTEIAGLAVREKFRKQGLATAITSQVTEEAFRRGVELAVLMAASHVEERMYARCGFETIGEVLHISKK